CHSERSAESQFGHVILSAAQNDRGRKQGMTGGGNWAVQKPPCASPCGYPGVGERAAHTYAKQQQKGRTACRILGGKRCDRSL
ncbi:MAG: hypothetical protein ABI396_11590, partial [Ktedonobacteraceae bacterium]